MCRLIALLILGCALVLNGPGAGLAQDATPATSPFVLPPDEPAYGAPYSVWVARQLQWEMFFPAAVSPATDPTGERCGYGQSGPVFYLATIVVGTPEVTRTCRVPTGVALLFPLFGNSCSTVEPPPYFGRNEAELLSCARTRIESFSPEATMVVSLDGVDVPDIGRYRVQTAPFTIAFSSGNAFDVEPLVATSVLDIYAILFAPLAPGEHILQFSLELPDGTVWRDLPPDGSRAVGDYPADVAAPADRATLVSSCDRLILAPDLAGAVAPAGVDPPLGANTWMR